MSSIVAEDCQLPNTPISDQYLNIDFCIRIGKSQIETYEMLHKVYQQNCLPRDRVYEYFAELTGNQSGSSAYAKAEHEQVKCKYCKLSFSSQKILLEHNKIHNVMRGSDEKNSLCYSCLKCGKSYALKRDLIEHINSYLDK